MHRLADEFVKSGYDPKDFNIAQLRMVYCAESEDQAWEECQDHLWHMLEFYAEILAEANDAEGDDAPLPVTKPSDMRHSVLAEHFMVGTPKQVAQKMEKFVAEKKVDTAQVKVFYTTPPYYDYNWTVHADMPAALRDKLAFLDDDKLAQFLMLCSFAHYGANQYKSNRVDQSAVIRLSEEYAINHTLIDAEVRAELCAKKYKDTHLAYLAAVSSGETPPKPVVYQEASPATLV